MKKTILSVALIFATLITCYAKKNAEPTVMTIDGKPVTLSEFEYLYNKNRDQSSNLTRDEYVDMFVAYKLKVLDAIAAGIDTLPDFKREFEGYRRDLAAPYLIDDAVRQRLIEEAYGHLLEDVDVSHVMLPHSQSSIEDERIKARLDSIRNEIIAGRATIDEMAVKFSVDPAVPRNHSAHMGWVSGNGMFPYRFVKAAFDTKIGEISPIVDSGFGYHIIKVNSRRQALGSVLAEHILKLTKGLPEQQAAVQKNAIDSIYAVVSAGADFADVARRESEDPGSASKGGRLDWFGPGVMVPEFEKVAFSLADGEISKPFATAYGYHIVKRIAHRGVPSFEESKKQIEAMIDNDERSLAPKNSKLDELREKYGCKSNQSVFDDMISKIKANGGYDSTLIAVLAADNRALVSMSGDQVTVADLIAVMPSARSKVPVDIAEPALRIKMNAIEEDKLIELAMDDLKSTNADYRNLLNEYRDGMLLFEISNRKVWERASKDNEGLDSLFNVNRDAYHWDAPRFKGYIVFASSDSVSRGARKFLDEKKIGSDSLALSLRQQFGKEIKIEKVIAAKGENDIVDAVAFGGDKPEPKNRWAYYFPYDYKLIDQPEEPADVRGAIVVDYQALLEKEWINSLKAAHKIKINKKVLKNVK